ncbi:hypothetical protein Busp01_18020 [Trinickia caryophylli]|uniref:Uncharacterized protein n=1 Tax=Trinickia caryophylli TaxID=28094 RepID=A0A1X7E9W2_TRICW|nr:hypothetical protein C0Z17_06945 [Trinickia caryophylli]GLU31960.1 hypothetical protein Busp01_18020 [Trinickia caryophylli]SMF29675.1 hypothetical protein SAMN06295900_10575 [Trinickia caryophylli]
MRPAATTTGGETTHGRFSRTGSNARSRKRAVRGVNVVLYCGDSKGTLQMHFRKWPELTGRSMEVPWNRVRANAGPRPCAFLRLALQLA